MTQLQGMAFVIHPGGPFHGKSLQTALAVVDNGQPGFKWPVLGRVQVTRLKQGPSLLDWTTPCEQQESLRRIREQVELAFQQGKRSIAL